MGKTTLAAVPRDLVKAEDTILEWKSVSGSNVIMSHGNGSRCWKCYKNITATEVMMTIVFRNPQRGVDDDPIYYHHHHCPSKFLKPE
ncbi:hypothetical protein ANRL3_01290 [Anaerolineae bacterium]|nr:hypothetical protein ANRL3_01290 [Anaerolineae bacterium]